MIRRRFQKGLTLVEVLVTVGLLAVLLIPAINALHIGAAGADVHADIASGHYQMTSRVEELLAEPFSDLSDAAIAAGSSTTPSSYSDPAGPPGRLLVYLSLYDGDNADTDDNPFTGTDDGLLWMRIDIEDSVHTLQTITARGF